MLYITDNSDERYRENTERSMIAVKASVSLLKYSRYHP